MLGWLGRWTVGLLVSVMSLSPWVGVEITCKKWEEELLNLES